jgi:hypothetical protein
MRIAWRAFYKPIVRFPKQITFPTLNLLKAIARLPDEDRFMVEFYRNRIVWQINLDDFRGDGV